MKEFEFELALCAHLEGVTDDIIARQLGASRHGSRIIDILRVEPGPAFGERAAITEHRIPAAAIESDVGPGRARYWREAFDCHPRRARRAMETAVSVGFFEEDRRTGRRYVRQTGRYPDWFGQLRGIENKPDLASPGDLETQLRIDVSLAVLDEIVLATESYVTRAHLERIPAAVGVWRFDPEEPALTEIRSPHGLPVGDPGVEVVAEHPGRMDIRHVSTEEKARLRRHMAERAYGKGWRTWTFPGCRNCVAGTVADTTGLPACRYHGRIVHPAEACGADCPGYDPVDAHEVDLRAERDRHSPWRANPSGRARRQARLDHFE